MNIAYERRTEPRFSQCASQCKKKGSKTENTKFLRADEASQNDTAEELNRLRCAFLQDLPFCAVDCFVCNSPHVGVDSSIFIVAGQEAKND